MALDHIKITAIPPEAAERLQAQVARFTSMYRPELEPNFAEFMLELGKTVGAAICYGAALSDRPVEIQVKFGEKVEMVR